MIRNNFAQNNFPMDYQIIIDDYIGDWWLGTDKRSIRRQLARHKDEHVDVKISSLGGSLDDGLDIRQQFIDHGDVTAHLHGFVASAATVLAMGAKRIVMGKYALFLVHQCSNEVFEWGQMNATDLQTLIDRLQKNKEDNEKIDGVLAAMYASRCKNHSQEELLDLLKEDKWLTAQEALDWGFVDEVVDQPAEEAPAVTNAVARRFNALGLTLNGLEVQPDRPGFGLKLQAILDGVGAIRDLLTGKKSNSETNQHNQEKSMKKKILNFIALAMALSMAKLECEEGGTCQLTDEQLGVLDSRMNELTSQHDADQTAIAERDATIAELRKQVANLQKAPGEETGKVDETTGEDAPAAATSKDLYDSIKDII